MDFKRLPFQFSSTDPSKRQEELQKRFGLQTLRDNMFVDFPNYEDMLSSKGDGLTSGSPRLQHRVPIFKSDPVESVSPSIDSQVSPSLSRKPVVRNIPIQMETAPSFRENLWKNPYLVSQRAHPFGSAVRNTRVPVVSNIPVKVEKRKESNGDKSCKAVPTKTVIGDVKKVRAEKVSKMPKEPVTDCVDQQNDNKPLIEDALKKIDVVKEKMISYRKDVEEFSGVHRDKKYRYLDEMLTRCMLDLDAIETYGCEIVRLARKSMVKEVQACIDLLDTKVRNPETLPTVSQTSPLDEMLDRKEIVPDIAEEKSNHNEIENVEMKEVEALVSSEESPQMMSIIKNIDKVDPNFCESTKTNELEKDNVKVLEQHVEMDTKEDGSSEKNEINCMGTSNNNEGSVKAIHCIEETVTTDSLSAESEMELVTNLSINENESVKADQCNDEITQVKGNKLPDENNVELETIFTVNEIDSVDVNQCTDKPVTTNNSLEEIKMELETNSGVNEKDSIETSHSCK